MCGRWHVCYGSVLSIISCQCNNMHIALTQDRSNIYTLYDDQVSTKFHKNQKYRYRVDFSIIESRVYECD